MLCTGKYTAPFCGKSFKVAAAFDDHRTKLGFQRSQRVGERWLCDVAGQRCTTEVLMFVKCHQLTKRSQQVHGVRFMLIENRQFQALATHHQVVLEIVILGNFAEKSFALAATVIATLRATAL